MTCYEELKARGLIAQVTNEEEISKMINEGKATFYIGFDCTADSLHVGHFMQLIIMALHGSRRGIAPLSCWAAVPRWWVTPQAKQTCAKCSPRNRSSTTRTNLKNR